MAIKKCDTQWGRNAASGTRYVRFILESESKDFQEVAGDIDEFVEGLKATREDLLSRRSAFDVV